MANWVKFSDRMPTESSVDSRGDLIILKAGNWYTVRLQTALRYHCFYRNHYWLENVPPTPRTLEDVALEFVTKTQQHNPAMPSWWLESVKEMREILERKDNE